MRKLLLRLCLLGMLLAGMFYGYQRWQWNTRQAELRAAAVQAVARNNRTEFLRIVQDLETVNVERNGTPLLSLAVSRRYYEIVEALLEHGADPNRRDSDGRTLLELVARFADFTDSEADATAWIKLAELLIQHGASVNNPEGLQPPLHAAVRARLPWLTALLLERDADVNARDRSGLTPLMALCDELFDTMGSLRGDVRWVARLLIQHGAEVNVADPQGRTALMHAARSGLDTVVPLLLQAGADVQARDAEGRDALIWAGCGASVEAVEIVPILLRAGAEVDSRDASGRTALSHAAENNGFVMYTLLQSGADPHAQDRQGKTVLDYALQHRQVGVRSAVLEDLQQAMAKKRP